jgi:adenine-specific DNA glycosylase
MGIKTYIAIYEHVNKYTDITFNPEDFIFDHDNNCYICPNNCTLKYSGFAKGKGAKRYSASTKDCRICPLKSQCIAGEERKYRVVQRPYHQTEIDIQHENNNTARYKEIMRKRQVWCEGNNSHQKARHCLERAKMRGIERVTEQCLLSACAFNLKRLVKGLKKASYTCVFSRFKLFICFFDNCTVVLAG